MHINFRRSFTWLGVAIFVGRAITTKAVRFFLDLFIHMTGQ
jgi:hypothetical protein